MHFWQDTKLIVALRGFQFAFALIVLGLSGYVTHWWHTYWHASSPSQTNFLLFCAVWTFIALAFLIVVPWRFATSRIGNMWFTLGMEFVTMIFWFAGFVGTACFLGDRVCFGGVCNAARAATAFGAFEWLLFSAMFTLNMLRYLNGGDAPAPALPSHKTSYSNGY